jgi:hypothetical protein
MTVVADALFAGIWGLPAIICDNDGLGAKVPAGSAGVTTGPAGGNMSVGEAVYDQARAGGAVIQSARKGGFQ